MVETGTDVGQRSPYTGNIISKKIVISGGRVTTSKSPSSSSSASSSSSSSKSYPETVSLTKQQTDFYNSLPDSEKEAYLRQKSVQRVSGQVNLTREQYEFQQSLPASEQEQYVRQVSSRSSRPKQVVLSRQQSSEISKLPLSEQKSAVERIQSKSTSSDVVQRLESGLGRDLNPFERSAVRFQQFTTPENQKKALKRTASTYELAGRQVLNVFTPGQKFTDVNKSDLSYQDKATLFLTSPGFVFGAPAFVAGGGAISSGIKTATKGSKVLTFGTELLGTTARGLAVSKGTQEVGKITTDKQYESLINSKKYKDAVSSAYALEAESISKQPFYKGLAYDLNPAFGEKNTFIKGLKKAGLTDEEVEVALRERRFRSSGEALALLEISRSAEASGRKAIKTVGKKVGDIGGKGVLKTGLAVAPSVGQAGFQEGFSSVLVQQQSRGRKIDVREALGGGALGAVSASTLGGVIGGFAVGGKSGAPLAKRSVTKGTGKAVEFVANITDPFEKPGDLLQDIFERVGGRRGRSGVRGSEISKTISVREARGVVPSVKFGGVKTVSLTSVRSQPQSFVNIKETTRSKTSALTGVPEFTKVKVPSFINPLTTTNTKINTNLNVPVKETTQSQVQVPSEVPAMSQVPVNVQVPVSTPLFRLPPPLPLPAGSSLGSGFGKRGIRGGSTFVNEVSRTLGALSAFGVNNRRKKK